MTDSLYIDTAKRKKIATRWVVITLWALHLWATTIIAAVVFGPKPSDLLAAMFSTVCFGIGATLAILLLDRAADAILSRFSIPSAAVAGEVKETVTHTVTTTPESPVL